MKIVSEIVKILIKIFLVLLNPIYIFFQLYHMICMILVYHGDYIICKMESYYFMYAEFNIHIIFRFIHFSTRMHLLLNWIFIKLDIVKTHLVWNVKEEQIFNFEFSYSFISEEVNSQFITYVYSGKVLNNKDKKYVYSLPLTIPCHYFEIQKSLDINNF